MFRYSSRSLPCIVAGIGLAILSTPASVGSQTRLLRQPTLSATHVAFTYGSDLWVADRNGGVAKRLTSTPAVEGDPRFSPDGKQIAFTSNRSGVPQVYVVAVDGGEPIRLTWYPTASMARGRSPDGERVLYASRRESAPTGYNRLWTVPRSRGSPPSRSDASSAAPFTFCLHQLPYPAKQYPQPSSCARAAAITPEGTNWMPGSNPAIHSRFTASAAIPIFCAAAPAFRVIATSQTATRIPPLISSAMPRPGIGRPVIVANLNVDGGNVLGVSRDLNVLGESKSSLGPQLSELIAPQQMRTSPDAFPERGYFYRSDHFSFAKSGVPSVSIGAGDDFVGRPPEWGTQQSNDYNTNRYHQPADEYSASWDLRGAVQLSNIVLEFTRSLANSREWPTWNADAEFRRPVRKPAM